MIDYGLLEAEKKRLLLERLEEIREARRRSQVIGSGAVSLGMFLLLVSWVVLGFSPEYLLAGALGSILVGLGFYLFVSEPRLGAWVTLADEVEDALRVYEDPARLREEVESLVERHPDERELGRAVTEILSETEDSRLRGRLEEVIRRYRGLREV